MTVFSPGMRTSDSSSSVLSGRAPPSFSLESLMDLHPSIVDLLRCGKAFYANGAGRISNDDFVTGSIGLRPHLALNRLVPALEEVEHARRLLHGLRHPGRGSKTTVSNRDKAPQPTVSNAFRGITARDICPRDTAPPSSRRRASRKGRDELRYIAAFCPACLSAGESR